MPTITIAECMQRLDKLERRHNGLTETFEQRDAEHDRRLADLERRADFNDKWRRQAHDSRLSLRDRLEKVERALDELAVIADDELPHPDDCLCDDCATPEKRAALPDVELEPEPGRLGPSRVQVTESPS